MKKTNGEVWLDSEGKRIQAHGGCVLFHQGTYYWYGENKAGITRKDPAVGFRVDVVGISCYRSDDLITWDNLGIVLTPTGNSLQDTHPSKVIERPKVLYCSETKKFVMWMHTDRADYQLAAAGVAISESPEGPFQYLQTVRPYGLDSRDQTVIIDNDAIAWHFASTDHNRTTLVSRLTNDYISFTSDNFRLFEDREMEAHAVINHNQQYYYLASGCSGWDPNEARSARASQISGPWTELGNPCVGPGGERTFDCQSTFMFKTQDGRIIAMFDRWVKEDLSSSGYAWLPVEFRDGRMIIPWQDFWTG